MLNVATNTRQGQEAVNSTASAFSAHEIYYADFKKVTQIKEGYRMVGRE